MVRVRERLLPDIEKKPVYDRKFALFVKAVAALDGLWQDFDAPLS